MYFVISPSRALQHAATRSQSYLCASQPSKRIASQSVASNLQSPESDHLALDRPCQNPGPKNPFKGNICTTSCLYQTLRESPPFASGSTRASTGNVLLWASAQTRVKMEIGGFLLRVPAHTRCTLHPYCTPSRGLWSVEPRDLSRMKKK